MPRKANSDPPDSSTVTFRVSGAALRRLQEEATAAEVSLSKRAQQILDAVLTDEFQREILAEQRQLRVEVADLRGDVLRSLVCILDTLQPAPAPGVERMSADELLEEARRYLGSPRLAAGSDRNPDGRRGS